MQGVILAHSEPAELTQLTLTKSCCGLPIGCSTILHNIIDRFLDSDVSDIIITHTDSQAAFFEKFITDNSKKWPVHINISLYSVASDCTISDCFNRLRSQLSSTYVFFVYSVTLLTSLDLRKVFLALIRHNAAMVAVLSSLPTAESKLFKSLPRELVVTDRSGMELMGYFPSTEIKKNALLPRHLILRGPGVLLRNDLRDLGFCLFTLAEVDSIIRIRDKRKHLWQLLTRTTPSTELQDSALTRVSTDTTGDESRGVDVYWNVKEPCGICLFEHIDKRISMKLVDPLSYLEATRLYLQKSSQNLVDSAKPAGKQNVQKDSSFIGPNCTIDPKAFISNSQLTSECIIGANVRILNCVLLTGVVIKDDCIVQGCVLGDQVTLETQCHLKNCAVAASQRVPGGTNLEGEQLGFTDPELEVSQT